MQVGVPMATNETLFESSGAHNQVADLRMGLAQTSNIEDRLSVFEQALVQFPNAIIPLITLMYDGRESDWSSGNAQIDALAGGPHEGVTWPLYNAVGAAYPSFTRDQRDAALRQLLNIFDGINYAYVQGEWGVGHTTGIHEPLLLADITLARPLYWPGLDEGKIKLQSHTSFDSFANTYLDENGSLKGVNSAFVVSYSLLRSDFCSFGERYAAVANPAFLNQTMKGIVAMRFGRPSKEDWEASAERLKKLLPASLHDRIEPLRQEADWTDYKKFR